MTLAHISQPLVEVVSNATPRPTNLRDLASFFAEREELDNPDIVTPLDILRMTEEGTLAIPGQGTFALTDWTRQQLSNLLGIRWDRWFETTNALERADEINRRLSRRSNAMRLRTSRVALTPNGKPGILRAIVSPAFTPIADSRLAMMLMACLRDTDHELKVSCFLTTDRTVSYVIAIGKPFGVNVSDRVVGDVAGNILIRNSGVGFASLIAALHLVRLVCMNGLICPVDDPIALRQPHRSFDEQRLIAKLTEGFANLPGRLADGARRLAAARSLVVSDPLVDLMRLLRDAHLPQRLLPQLESAYALEPEATAFGISQAATRASQKLTPEERFELDRAAGLYLLHLLSAR
jgi:hypothetical protein